MREVPASKLKFLDESGCHRSFTRLYGWAKRSERCVEAVPSNRGKNQSVIGVCSLSQMLCWQVQEGSVKADTVSNFVFDSVLSCLEAGDVLILVKRSFTMDNAAVHSKGLLQALVATKGARLVFLPPYSPDFSPIEFAWKEMKGHLRREEYRDYDTLRPGIEQALKKVTAEQMQAFYKHCGYLNGLQP